jgi:predicted nucleic acid-binding protein
VIPSPRQVIVCDASVALAWLLDEAVPAWVGGFRARVEAARVDVRVPTLFWLEIGNRLMRQPQVTDEQVMEGVVRLEALGFQTIEMDRPLRLMAVQLARQHRLSIYDAVYLALAETSDLPLATLDGRLADAATEMGRRHGHDPSPRRSHRTHESPAAYGTARRADPMSLAALGAYLAELRKEIAVKGRGSVTE